ncbi:MAG: hypothetical protein ABIP74_02735 [Candidatus Saccharimonas sp.]
MDKVSTRRPKWRLARKIATVLVTVVVALGFVATTAVTAEAAAACSLKVGKTYPGGPGHPSKVRAGVWKCGSHEGFCVDFGDGVSNSTSVKSISKIPGLSKAKSQQVMLLANLYSDTKDPVVGADAGLAIWRIVGGHDINTWYPYALKHGYISSAQDARINQLIKDSKKSVTRVLSVKATAVFPGKKLSSGSVTVVDGKGKPVAGVMPKVTLSKNAKFVTKPGKTDANGVTKFTIKVIDVGMVHIETSLTGPSSTKAYLTRSGAGHQRILVGGVTAVYTATTQFEKRPGYEIKTVCNSDCEGVAKVTFKASMEKKGLPARFTFFTGDHVWKKFDVAPGKTVSRLARIPDGTKVSGTYAYLNKVGGKVISKTVSLKSFEVICPPWLKVTSKVDCDCKGAAKITLKLSAPGGARYYKAVVQKNGKAIVTKKLGHSAQAQVSVTLKHGDRLAVSFTAYKKAYKGALVSGKPYDITWN